MGNAWANFAWKQVKDDVKSWMRSRALVLPTEKVTLLARKWKVPEDAVRGLNQEFIDNGVAQLDRIKF